MAPQDYKLLAEHCTDVIPNAWPMSGTRLLKAFEPQLQALRNLFDLVRIAATLRPTGRRARIGFQFVSSIGGVGNAGVPRALEQHIPMTAVLPGGYPEAK